MTWVISDSFCAFWDDKHHRLFLYTSCPKPRISRFCQALRYRWWKVHLESIVCIQGVFTAVGFVRYFSALSVAKVKNGLVSLKFILGDFKHSQILIFRSLHCNWLLGFLRCSSFLCHSPCLSFFSLQLMKKSGCLSCIISHRLDFANCVPTVWHNMFFSISSTMAVRSGGSIKFWLNFWEVCFSSVMMWSSIRGSNAWCALFVMLSVLMLHTYTY